ncbi:MAG TPA: hypothetical protein VFR48_10390 [Solirubrobacteraceae bacterium]|nr:hypothetical protein [Solirubrobacteraceae bacterium]
MFSPTLDSATILLGETATLSHKAYISPGRSQAFRFRSIASGTAAAAQVYVDSGNTATTIVVGLYADASGHPGALLSTGVINFPTAGIWNTLSLSARSIAAGGYYWMALLGEGGSFHYRNVERGSCLSATSLQGNLTGLPSTLSIGRTHHECPVSGYVTAESVILSPPLPPPLPSAPLPAAPANTALPSVTGTTTEGQTLSASTGSWSGSPTSYAYQWQACDGSGSNCVDVAGASGPSYLLNSGDVGHTLRVTVSATNAGGSGSVASLPTASVVALPPPPPPAPSNTALPAIAGTATEGLSLSASTGSWSGSPTSFAYQWQDCDTSGLNCTNIGGAGSSTYLLSETDVGRTIRVVVSATNASGTSLASSAPSAVVGASLPAAPTNTVMPAVSGKPMAGQVLNTSNGGWTGSPTTYSYQWRDCSSSGRSCASIAGATQASYKLSQTDVNHTMRVMVTATNAGGSSSMSSPATTIVAESPPAAPANTALPSVSGTATEGQTLSASTGSWSGSPTSYAYQWQDCEVSGEGCVDINEGSASSYTLTAGDVGDTIRVLVTATNGGGSASASSASSSVVIAEPPPPPPPPAPSNTALPVISGTTTEGQTLSATTGSWSGSPTSYAYQWQDCNVSGASCVNIGGAMTSSYKLTGSDVEDTIRVVVTATNSGGFSSAVSSQTASVVAVPPPPPPSAPSKTALPSVSGTATEGQTLSASTGSWSGSPTSYAYQWQDCNASGASCVNIGGATSSSYKLTGSDVEHTVRVAVTATNSGGSSSASSAASSVVNAAVVTTGCTTTIGSGLATAIKNAAAGSTICLNAGNYGEVSVTTSKSSMVTIKPAAGVSQSQAVLGYANVTTSSNITFEGLTIAGGNAGSSSAPATHIHWISDVFTSGLCILTPTSANIDILVEGSTFFNIGEGKGGCGNEGRLEINGENKGVSGTNGVVISHSTFGRNGCTDGVNITGGGSGTVIGPGDVFENMKEGSCAAHVDPIQFYGAQNTTVTGDYFHGNSDGIMSPDGNGSPMTVTNDVFDTDGEYPWQIVIGGGSHDVISHDTFGHGAMVRIGHVNVGASSSETISNNVLTGGLDLTEGQSTSGFTMVNNLAEGQSVGTSGIVGKPTYVGGGSEPSTWAGWALASGSLGHLGAADGTDIGSSYFGS